MSDLFLYRKTFRFTLMRVVVRLVGALIIIALPVAAALITAHMDASVTVLSTGGALLAGIVVVSLLSRYVGYLYRAGQIAIVARAVAFEEMPDQPFQAGKAAVKQRFLTVSVFSAIDSAIRSIVNQITRAVNKVTDKVAGNNKNAKTAAAAVNLFISALLKYVCACCLGWVFAHPEQNPWRSACNGAIVYFRNWKALLKNTGKVILFTLISLAVMGGLLFGLIHLIFDRASFMSTLTDALIRINEEQNLGILLTGAQWALVVEGAAAFVLWIVLHSAFVDPFIMVSVMRQYMKAGLENPPASDQAMDAKLSGMSKGYRKALEMGARA